MDEDEESPTFAAEVFAFAASQGPAVYLRCPNCAAVWGDWAKHSGVCVNCEFDGPLQKGIPYEGPMRAFTCPDCKTPAEAPTETDRALCGVCATSYPI